MLFVNRNLDAIKINFTFIGDANSPLLHCVKIYFDENDNEYRNPNLIVHDNISNKIFE